MQMKRSGIPFGVLYVTIYVIGFFDVPRCQGQVSSDVKEMIGNFPISNPEALIETIDPGEYQRLLKNDSSENWMIVTGKDKPNTILIVNKRSPDNSIEFCGYKTNTGKWLFGVQQNDAQNQKTDVWLYTLNKKVWDLYPMPAFVMKDFVSEHVVLPVELNFPASPYLSAELGKAITFKINTFTFLKEAGNYFSIDGSALEHNYIKYSYVLGTSLILEKKQDEDFATLLLMSASVEDEREDGLGLDEFNCPQGVSVTTSSELPAQSTFQYKGTNLLDASNKTAWSEGVKGAGIGEWVEFTIIDRFIIGESYQVLNGYTKDKNSWTNNGRVKKLKCFVNGKAVAHIFLQDNMNFQSFTISPVWIKQLSTFEKGDKIRFVIEEVYKGLKYNDTLLSQFVPTGNCG
jgi:hypothetical protein